MGEVKMTVRRDTLRLPPEAEVTGWDFEEGPTLPEGRALITLKLPGGEITLQTNGADFRSLKAALISEPEQ